MKWVYKGSGTGDFGHDFYEVDALDEDKGILGEGGFYGTEEDAKLISAAPELLEALIELKRWIPDTEVAKEALKLANNAINKALK